MRKTPNTRTIGTFVLFGFIVFFTILFSFLKDDFFPDDDNLVVMYFDESVKGLNVGSPVVFKGVEIGKISRIDLVGNAETLRFSIPVYARLMPTQNVLDTEKNFRRRKANLDAFIERGLRAKLVSQSLLTGQLMVELEVLPNSPIILKNAQDDILEIPTVLSSIEKLSQGLQNLPIRYALEQLNDVLQKMDKGLGTLMPQMEKIATALGTIAETSAPKTDMTLNNFNQTLLDVSEAAKSVRDFADYMERHPEAFLKGKGGY